MEERRYRGRNGKVASGVITFDSNSKWQCALFTGDEGVHGRELWVLRPEDPLLGDLNSDGAVGETDAALMFASWGTSGVGDLNFGWNRGCRDASILFEHWTETSYLAPKSFQLLLGRRRKRCPAQRV